MKKYSIGIDFGTLSARAVIADIANGEEIAESVMDYSHGVMSERLWNGDLLADGYALQHPGDYLECLYYVTGDVIKKSQVSPENIIGVGVDFTASTVMPVTEDGTPLCFLDEFKYNPHAYVKLWKHTAAQNEADDITKLLEEFYPQKLESYGGKISSQWLFSKVLQILRQDENVYNKTSRFMEAGDWIVSVLTGSVSSSICMAGFKALWDENTGYPSKEFFASLDPRMENIIGDKISTNIIKMSDTAGYITKSASLNTGLKEGTRVAPAFIDAHAALPALGITQPGSLLMILGTSSCHILLGETQSFIPGIAGCVKDGIVDTLYAYEAGQSCVGDSFDWFVINCVPYSCYIDAEKSGINIHKYLREKAKKLVPGSNGLLALDWWNGNRTPYDDGNLTGIIVGLNLFTKPEEIYRALIEATAYGTRSIIELYENSGVEIKTLYATGGIAHKDELFMQIYADVLQREILLSETAQGCALGSAVLGSVGINGHKDIFEASEKMGKIKEFSYKPNKDNKKAYDIFYNEYKKLCEKFGDGKTMKALKNI